MNEKIEVLKTANEYICSLIHGIKKAVEYFYVGEESKGCELIADIADGITWIAEVFLITKDIHQSDFDRSFLQENLKIIVVALENENYVLVGDLFLYEVLPIIVHMQDVFKKYALS